MNDSSTSDRVVYLGSGRRLQRRWFGWQRSCEPDSEWQQQLAQEMEAAGQEMSRRGLRLVQIVPVMSAAGLRGSSTEGVWLYFTQSTPHESAQQDQGHQFMY